jgi:tetratricopeptide (TPR) repeat protein
MTRPGDPKQVPGQPPLAELLARYLQRQVSDHAAGLGAEAVGEVVPFEAAPVQPVDARLAWEEAVYPLSFLAPKAKARSWPAPPQWPQLVAGHEPAMALAFCVGNFPQLLRNFQPLLQTANLAALRPAGDSRPTAAPALADWANEAARRNQFPQTLLALGGLRLAKHFDQAAELLARPETDVPAEWRAAWANEAAALAWHRGRGEEALAAWQEQADSIPVLFNRGMAELFLDRPAQARAPLGQAVQQLPDDSAWHHLARLYLTLAEIRK